MEKKMQNDTVFVEEIFSLINLHTEGEYWDFKEAWHENQADLLHDIYNAAYPDWIEYLCKVGEALVN